jgi:small subunit ribosomal protein S18
MAERERRSDKSEMGDKGAIPGAPRQPKAPVTKLAASGKAYLDYKETETLRKLTSSNGKISSRRRTGATALEQRMVSDAVKRARYMALAPYVTAAQ